MAENTVPVYRKDELVGHCSREACSSARDGSIAPFGAIVFYDSTSYSKKDQETINRYLMTAGWAGYKGKSLEDVIRIDLE